MNEVCNEEAGQPDVVSISGGQLTLSVPIQIKRRAGRKVVKLPGGNTLKPRSPNDKPTLIQWRWRAAPSIGDAGIRIGRKSCWHVAEDNVTKMSTASDTRSFACLCSYQTALHVNRVSVTAAPVWPRLGGRNRVVINVVLVNRSIEPWVSTRDSGSVFMSHELPDSSGKVVIDGIRSALPSRVLPGQTVDADVITILPDASNLALRLSPLQER